MSSIVLDDLPIMKNIQKALVSKDQSIASLCPIFEYLESKKIPYFKVLFHFLESTLPLVLDMKDIKDMIKLYHILIKGFEPQNLGQTDTRIKSQLRLYICEENYQLAYLTIRGVLSNHPTDKEILGFSCMLFDKVDRAKTHELMSLLINRMKIV